MAHDELIEALLRVEGNRPDSFGVYTQWHRNPEGPRAVEALTTAQAEIEALREALDDTQSTLAAIRATLANGCEADDCQHIFSLAGQQMARIRATLGKQP